MRDILIQRGIIYGAPWPWTTLGGADPASPIPHPEQEDHMSGLSLAPLWPEAGACPVGGLAWQRGLF